MTSLAFCIQIGAEPLECFAECHEATAWWARTMLLPYRWLRPHNPFPPPSFPGFLPFGSPAASLRASTHPRTPFGMMALLCPRKAPSNAKLPAHL